MTKKVIAIVLTVLMAVAISAVAVGAKSPRHATTTTKDDRIISYNVGGIAYRTPVGHPHSVHNV